MIKIKLNKEVKDINGNTITYDEKTSEKLTVGIALCSVLGNGATPDFLRAVELGLMIRAHKTDEMEISKADADFLKSIVRDSKFIDIVKYTLTKELE